jgi:hypothetical protein
MRKLSLYIFLFFSIGMLTQCGGPRGYRSAFYTNNGVRKPVVALMPVKDLSKSKVYQSQAQWNIPSELKGEIAERIQERQDLILMPEKQAFLLVEREREGFKAVPNPLDFKVYVEIVSNSKEKFDHEKVQYSKISQGPVDHMIRVQYRLTVEDVRDQENPKVVLRELKEAHYPVGKKTEIVEYEIANWPAKSYIQTPLGQSHKRVAQQVAQRLEEYLPFYERY